MGVVFLVHIALAPGAQRGDIDPGHLGAHAPGHLQGRAFFVVGRAGGRAPVFDGRARVLQHPWGLHVASHGGVARQGSKVVRPPVVDDHQHLGLHPQLRVLRGRTQAGTQGRPRLDPGGRVHVMHLDGVARHDAAMRTGAHPRRLRPGQLGGREAAGVAVAGAKARAVAVARVEGELPALVLGVVVHVDVAQVHGRVRRGHAEGDGVLAPGYVQVTRSLRAVALARRLRSQVLLLAGDDRIRDDRPRRMCPTPCARARTRTTGQGSHGSSSGHGSHRRTAAGQP